MSKFGWLIKMMSKFIQIKIHWLQCDWNHAIKTFNLIQINIENLPWINYFILVLIFSCFHSTWFFPGCLFLLFIIRSFDLIICGFIYLHVFLSIKACSHACSTAAFFCFHLRFFLRIQSFFILARLGEHAAWLVGRFIYWWFLHRNI